MWLWMNALSNSVEMKKRPLSFAHNRATQQTLKLFVVSKFTTSSDWLFISISLNVSSHQFVVISTGSWSMCTLLFLSIRHNCCPNEMGMIEVGRIAHKIGVSEYLEPYIRIFWWEQNWKKSITAQTHRSIWKWLFILWWPWLHYIFEPVWPLHACCFFFCLQSHSQKKKHMIFCRLSVGRCLLCTSFGKGGIYELNTRKNNNNNTHNITRQLDTKSKQSLHTNMIWVPCVFNLHMIFVCERERKRILKDCDCCCCCCGCFISFHRFEYNFNSINSQSSIWFVECLSVFFSSSFELNNCFEKSRTFPNRPCSSTIFIKRIASAKSWFVFQFYFFLFLFDGFHYSLHGVCVLCFVMSIISIIMNGKNNGYIFVLCLVAILTSLQICAYFLDFLMVFSHHAFDTRKIKKKSI